MFGRAGCIFVTRATLKELSGTLVLKARDLLDTERMSVKEVMTVLLSYPEATR